MTGVHHDPQQKVDLSWLFLIHDKLLWELVTGYCDNFPVLPERAQCQRQSENIFRKNPRYPFPFRGFAGFYADARDLKRRGDGIFALQKRT